MWRIITAAIVASVFYYYIEDNWRSIWMDLDFKDEDGLVDPLFPKHYVFWFSIGLFVFLAWWWRKKPKKFCAWCGNKSGLTKEKEYEGRYVWEYPNKDGSEDKRKKGNFQKANYFSFWRCKKCNALTRLQHDFVKNPSASVKEILQVTLSEDGEGERTAKDWAMKGLVSVSGVRE